MNHNGPDGAARPRAHVETLIHAAIVVDADDAIARDTVIDREIAADDHLAIGLARHGINRVDDRPRPCRKTGVQEAFAAQPRDAVACDAIVGGVATAEDDLAVRLNGHGIDRPRRQRRSPGPGPLVEIAGADDVITLSGDQATRQGAALELRQADFCAVGQVADETISGGRGGGRNAGGAGRIVGFNAQRPVDHRGLTGVVGSGTEQPDTGSDLHQRR